jgi:hypothetical protein
MERRQSDQWLSALEHNMYKPHKNEKELMMRHSRLKAVRTFMLAMVCFMAIAGQVKAEEEKPTADLTVSALSQYIWRGQELSQDSIVIQPSMTVEYKGFGFNLWGNLDTDYYDSEADTNTWNETDMTLSYSRGFGPVSATAGYIYYGLEGLDDSQEVFVSLGLDVLLSPTVTIYREFSHYPSWYITAGVSHSFALPNDMSLDLGAQASYLLSDDEDAYGEVDADGNVTGKFSNFHDGTISAVLNIPVAQYITVTPQVYWTFPIVSDASDEMEARSVDEDDDSFVYGGVSVSFAF